MKPLDGNEPTHLRQPGPVFHSKGKPVKVVREQTVEERLLLALEVQTASTTAHTQALLKLAESIAAQAQAVSDLVDAMIQQDEQQDEDDQPTTYMDGSPIGH